MMHRLGRRRGGWDRLWRVSGRGGRGGHALTRHRPHQGGGIVGVVTVLRMPSVAPHRTFHDWGGRGQGVRFDVGFGVGGPDLVDRRCVCPPWFRATRPLLRVAVECKFRVVKVLLSVARCGAGARRVRMFRLGRLLTIAIAARLTFSGTTNDCRFN